MAAVLALAGCAHTPPDEPSDPLEPVNRMMFRFNETADYFVMRPIAHGYDAITPDPVRTSIANFFDNLFYPTTILNDLLQAKFFQATQDFSRFLLNSTFGLAGFFDIATNAGLEQHHEDFGQTLGYWGLGPGWYLVIPMVGPSNNRDLIGKVGDHFTSPLTYTPWDVTWPPMVLNQIEERAGFMPFERLLGQQLDRYSFIRTLFLQRRLNYVYDGQPPKEELYGFDPDEE